VRQHEIDAVRSEPAQAFLQFPFDVKGRKASIKRSRPDGVGEFRANDGLLAAPSERLSKQFLGAAAARSEGAVVAFIAIRCVEEVHAPVESPGNQPVAFAPGYRIAESHRTEANREYANPGNAQHTRFHSPSPRRMYTFFP
jgi:hypothetical protein